MPSPEYEKASLRFVIALLVFEISFGGLVLLIAWLTGGIK
jgi:hypothetical protein